MNLNASLKSTKKRDRYKKKLSTLQEQDEEHEGSESSEGTQKKYGNTLTVDDKPKMKKHSKSQFVPKFNEND